MKSHAFLFLINPEAGKRTSRKLAREINASMAKTDTSYEYEIVMTEKSGHACELAHRFGQEHGENGVVYACGGDGTVNETVNGIFGTGAALGILPIGTANDFARHILPGLEPEDILSRLPFPELRPLDLIKVNEVICANITSFGLDSKVQRIANTLQRRLHIHSELLLYNLAILFGMAGGREYDLEYDMLTTEIKDGQPVRVTGSIKMVLAAICNGRYYGGGYNPAPAASSSDGVLDIVLVDNLPLTRIVKLLPKYKAGTHVGDPAMHMFSATEGVFRSHGGLLPGNYDGELFEAAEISFKVLPAAIRFAHY
ncbi:MAG: YegS/Rv2252/BmrU family lipid kinase [Ruminococcaceae bacterium]|nr:YegS/Rv2252/BmrU family lipid kinase [Oscillospiraceae bacterium]